MSVINTNTLSLVTQNNLTKSQGALNSAIERLSSGMRINSAKDDAAGQAVANRFTATIKGLTQASRNANDGISMAQTTEGALNEVNTNLQRIRELTVQSANGSNSVDDKASIQAEIDQRLDEIDRTSTQTDFNGTKVLAADKSLSIQVGANDGQSIAIDLKQIDRSTLNLTGFTVAGTAQVGTAAVTASSDFVAQVGTAATAASSNYAAASSNYAAQVGTAAVAASANYAAQVGTAQVGTAASSDYATGTIDLTTTPLSAQAGATGDGTFSVVTNGTDYFVTVSGNSDVADGNYAVTIDPTNGQATLGAIDATTDLSAFTAVANGDSFTSAGTAASTDYAAASGDYVAQVGTAAVAASGDYVAQVGTAQVGTAAVAASSDYVAQVGTAAAAASADYVAGTSSTLATIDAALKIVDEQRGTLGAVQNRFDSVIANLGTTIVNLSSSRSRIEDADYATEVSNMTRAQILQQAGTSVLAKANSSTEGVMSLLR